MTEILLVAAGGSIGAVMRYLIVRGLAPRLALSYPLAILIANVTGSFMLGILLAGTSREAFLLLGIGFCGALTTFSSFALDTVELALAGRRALTVVNVVVSVVVCVLAVSAGAALGQSLGMGS